MLPFTMRRGDRMSYLEGRLLSDLLVQSGLPRRPSRGGFGVVGGTMNDAGGPIGRTFAIVVTLTVGSGASPSLSPG